MIAFHRSFVVIIPLLSTFAIILIISSFFRFLVLFCITVSTSIILFCILVLFLYVNNSNSPYHSGESNYDISMAKLKTRLQTNKSSSNKCAITSPASINSDKLVASIRTTASSIAASNNFIKSQTFKSSKSGCDCGITMNIIHPIEKSVPDYHFGPYPSKRVAEMMQQLSSLVLQEYLLPVYTQMNWKTHSADEIRCHLVKLFERLTLRLSRIDWVTFVCNRWIRDFQKHLDSAMPVQDPSNRLSNSIMSPAMERQYAESVAERILVHVLDKELIQCATIKRILVAILAHQVLIPTANYICDPDNLSLWLMNYLKDRFKSASRSKRALYQYNSSYEEFFSAINALEDRQELKAIGHKIATEIRLVEVILLTKKNEKSDESGSDQRTNTNKETGKLDKGQLLVRRDLSRYRNQLNMCYRKVHRRLQILSNRAKSQNTVTLSDNELDAEESSFKTKKVKSSLRVSQTVTPKKKMNIILSFQVIMNCEIGRQHLNKYLKDKDNYCTMIELIEMIDHMETQPTQAYIIGRQIYQAYMKTSKPIYNFDKSLIAGMENFLKGDTSMTAFQQARGIIYNLLKDKWYASFLISQEYLLLVAAMGDSVVPRDQRSASCNDLLEATSSSGTESAAKSSSKNPFAYFNEDALDITPSDTEEDSLDDESESQISDAVPLIEDGTSNVDEFLPDDNTPLARSIKMAADPNVVAASQFYIAEDEEFVERETSHVSDFFKNKVKDLDTVIERKHLALTAMQTAQQETHNIKTRAQFDDEMTAVNRDIEQLHETRNRYLYHITRIDRWLEFSGNWVATVYNITAPSVSSVGSKLKSTLPFSGKSASKKSSSINTIMVELMVDLPSSINQPLTYGWLVTHELSDFHWLRRQLAQISPWLAKLPLPSTRNLNPLGSKYNEKYLTSAKEQINLFLKSILYDPRLCQNEYVFHFLCLSVEPEFQSKTFCHPHLPPTSQLNTTSSFSVTKALRSRVDSASSFAGKLHQIFGKPREGSFSSQSSATTRIRTSSSTECLNDRLNSDSDVRNRKSSMGNIADHEVSGVPHNTRKSHKQSKQALSDALFDLVEQLFQLKSSFNIPRRSLMHLVQVFYGKSLSEVLGEYVQWLISEGMIFYYLESFQHSYFPDKVTHESKCSTSCATGSNSPKLDRSKTASDNPNLKCGSQNESSSSAGNNAPSTSSAGKHFKPYNGPKLTVNEAAKRLLWDNVPDHVKMLCGTENCANGIGFIYETLQNPQANKVLFYHLLQSVLEEAFNDYSM